MQSISYSRAINPRATRSHCTLNKEISDKLTEHGFDYYGRESLHHALTHGSIVRVRLGDVLPDTQFGDHCFPSLVRQVTSEIQHDGACIVLRGDNVVGVKPARRAAGRPKPATAVAATTLKQAKNEVVKPKKKRHLKLCNSTIAPLKDMLKLARTILLRDSGSRVAAREGGIRVKLPGPSAYRVSVDKKAEQLLDRLKQLLDDGKFRLSSTVFRIQLMRGVEADWLKLAQQVEESEDAEDAHLMYQATGPYLDCLTEISVQKFHEKIKTQDRLVADEAWKILINCCEM